MRCQCSTFILTIVMASRCVCGGERAGGGRDSSRAHVMPAREQHSAPAPRASSWEKVVCCYPLQTLCVANRLHPGNSNSCAP